jgi:hypothetical protein
MRHTALTGWIEKADARQMCLEAATRTHPNDHRRAMKKALRAAAIAIPCTLAFIGGGAAVATISSTPTHFDCAGFPAVACHPVQ